MSQHETDSKFLSAKLWMKHDKEFLQIEMCFGLIIIMFFTSETLFFYIHQSL